MEQIGESKDAVILVEQTDCLKSPFSDVRYAEK